jgi:hypothetical protein
LAQLWRYLHPLLMQDPRLKLKHIFLVTCVDALANVPLPPNWGRKELKPPPLGRKRLLIGLKLLLVEVI